MAAEKFWEYCAHGLVVAGVCGTLMKIVGRPLLFSILNGRYETKEEARRSHAETIERIDRVECTVCDKVDGVEKRLEQIAGILMHR